MSDSGHDVRVRTYPISRCPWCKPPLLGPRESPLCDPEGCSAGRTCPTDNDLCNATRCRQNPAINDVDTPLHQHRPLFDPCARFHASPRWYMQRQGKLLAEQPFPQSQHCSGATTGILRRLQPPPNVNQPSAACCTPATAMTATLPVIPLSSFAASSPTVYRPEASFTMNGSGRAMGNCVGEPVRPNVQLHFGPRSSGPALLNHAMHGRNCSRVRPGAGLSAGKSTSGDETAVD